MVYWCTTAADILAYPIECSHITVLLLIDPEAFLPAFIADVMFI